MIEYPDHIASLCRNYYYQRISTAIYRQERRKIIEDMEELHNGIRRPSPQDSQSIAADSERG